MTQVPASSHGGSSAVSTLLGLSAAASIKTAADHTFLWDSVFDDFYNEHALGALPSGLGITSPLNGLTGDLTTTAAGIWAFTLTGQIAADATFYGQLQPIIFGVPADTVIANATRAVSFCTSIVVALPTGAVVDCVMTTVTAATTAAYTVSPFLSIVRLG